MTKVISVVNKASRVRTKVFGFQPRSFLRAQRNREHVRNSRQTPDKIRSFMGATVNAGDSVWSYPAGTCSLEGERQEALWV